MYGIRRRAWFMATSVFLSALLFSACGGLGDAGQSATLANLQAPSMLELRNNRSALAQLKQVTNVPMHLYQDEGTLATNFPVTSATGFSVNLSPSGDIAFDGEQYSTESSPQFASVRSKAFLESQEGHEVSRVRIPEGSRMFNKLSAVTSTGNPSDLRWEGGNGGDPQVVVRVVSVPITEAEEGPVVALAQADTVPPYADRANGVYVVGGIAIFAFVLIVVVVCLGENCIGKGIQMAKNRLNDNCAASARQSQGGGADPADYSSPSCSYSGQGESTRTQCPGIRGGCRTQPEQGVQEMCLETYRNGQAVPEDAQCVPIGNCSGDITACIEKYCSTWVKPLGDHYKCIRPAP